MATKKEFLKNLEKEVLKCDLLEDVFGLSFGTGDHFRSVNLKKLAELLQANRTNMEDYSWVNLQKINC